MTTECLECGMKPCVCEYDPLLDDEEASDFIKICRPTTPVVMAEGQEE